MEQSFCKIEKKIWYDNCEQALKHIRATIDHVYITTLDLNLINSWM